MEREDNTGALFINNKTKEKQPDYTGVCKVNGKDMRISCWKKVSQNGKTYLSMSFAEPTNKENKPKKQEVESNSQEDDAIPF